MSLHSRQVLKAKEKPFYYTGFKPAWFNRNRYRKCLWANDYSEGFRIDKDRPSECVEFKKHADQSHGNDMAKII